MIDAWRIEEFMAYAYPAVAYDLTPGVQEYFIGPLEVPPNFTGPRPTGIRDADVILNNVNPVLRVPLEIINVDRWADIAVQQIPNALPLKLYYVHDWNAHTDGSAGIFIWPGPLDSYQLELYASETMPFTEFPDLTTSFSFPPAYERMFRKNLAVNIAPMMALYNKLGRMSAEVNSEMLAMVKQQAVDSKEAVFSDNAPDFELHGDPAFCGSGTQKGWNWLTGTVGRSQR
jgi:hypothetical protein